MYRLPIANRVDTRLQYVAFVRNEGRRFHIQFPDAPGCEATADSNQVPYKKAKETIESWLRAQLEADEMPSWPGMHRTPAADERRLEIVVAPRLALAVQFRLMRREKGWSQTELARRVGVSQQQIGKIEDPDGNPTVETITKVAKAFDRPLVVVFK